MNWYAHIGEVSRPREARLRNLKCILFANTRIRICVEKLSGQKLAEIIRLCFYHFTSKLQSRLERIISDTDKREERGFVDTSMTEKLLPENSE